MGIGLDCAVAVRCCPIRAAMLWALMVFISASFDISIQIYSCFVSMRLRCR